MTSENHPQGRRSIFSRRSLLGLAITAPFLVFSRKASATFIPATKSLSIYNQATGESFNGIYSENGRYLLEQLVTLNRLWRDQHSGAVMQIDPDLFDLLSSIQGMMPARGPIELVSGYRTPESNRAARRTSRRVARNSLHMQGKAADIIVPGYSVRQMRAAAISLQGGGVGTYRRSRFIHVDTGPVRVW
jgi:uncharacterized protein YcbK (DUF882 family)